jgi:hypothetical protein
MGEKEKKMSVGRVLELGRAENVTAPCKERRTELVLLLIIVLA